MAAFSSSSHTRIRGNCLATDPDLMDVDTAFLPLGVRVVEGSQRLANTSCDLRSTPGKVGLLFFFF